MEDDSNQNCAPCALCAPRKTRRGDQLLRRPSARNHTSRFGNGTTVCLNSLSSSAACMMTLVRIELYPCAYFLTANCLHASCSRDLLAVGCGAGVASLLAASPSRMLAASAFSGAFSVPTSPFSSVLAVALVAALAAALALVAATLSPRRPQTRRRRKPRASPMPRACCSRHRRASDHPLWFAPPLAARSRCRQPAARCRRTTADTFWCASPC